MHYFSDRLLRKLEEVQFAHATVVEAPRLRQDTAVRDYLEAKRQEGIPVYWFTATEESPSAGFRRLCREISSVDDEAGQRLLRFDLPNAVTIGEVWTQSAPSDAATRRTWSSTTITCCTTRCRFFFLALIEHVWARAPRRHPDPGAYARDGCRGGGQGFLHITTSDLRLNAGDISQYYSLAGCV
jgi:LuxR family maltose regulon positive regulatory protein